MSEFLRTDVDRSGVRVRFCPSPTGNPHVGLVRTALYNYAWCRHVGGAFVFRIEDTDAARDSEASYLQLLSAMRWLGFEWDEGPEVGGPYGPYRQSERRGIYDDVARRLLEGGYVYESFTTTEETEARHTAAGRDPKLGYDNHDRGLTDEEKAAFRADGRAPVLRFRMPDGDIRWDDLVRGEITFAASQVSDFVVVRANGDPLYTLTNPVDDAMMRITHVLRGEDLLPSTPRQIALYGALVELGVAPATPQFGHLPYVMGEGNKKLSKRDPQASLDLYRQQGYLPEGLLNYLALLGWSIAADRDVFSVAEMIDAFEISAVGGNPARFDGAKCLALNGDHIRQLSAGDFAERLLAYAGEYRQIDVAAYGAALRDGAPLVQERCKTLGEAVDLLGFLVVGEAFALEEKAAAKALNDDGRAVLAAGLPVLESLPAWEHATIETALRELIEARELKLGKALAPFRVAVTGGTVSPPLFESMALLGREDTLARLRAAIG